MNQYQIANAAGKIDGYFDPRPSESVDRYGKAFERAQAECLSHLKAQVDAVAGMSFEQFMTFTKRKKLHDTEVAAAH